jgi:hypothetical protein
MNVFAGTITTSPGGDPRCEERKAKRIRAVRDADAVTAAAVGGERALELAHGRAVRERAGVQEARKVVEDLRLQPVVDRREIEKGDSRPLPEHAVRR